jgi:hypothetical protein
MKRGRRARRSGGSFAAIPHVILQSGEYAALSARAVKLLLDVFGQFNGRNNGDLAAAPSMMRERGWKSNAMLSGALAELLDTGFLVQTRMGGRNRAALYAVTWLGVNDCEGKLDARPGSGAPLLLWKAAHRSEVSKYRLASSAQTGENENAIPPAGQPSPPAGQSRGSNVARFPARGVVAA